MGKKIFLIAFCAGVILGIKLLDFGKGMVILMSETRYMISDASKMIDVEPHVLRYWEIELAIDIPRNELGHRYFVNEQIELLKSVKALKDKGFQLKAIKLLLPEIKKVEALEADKLNDLRSKLEVAMGLVGIESKEHVEEEKYRDENEVAIMKESTDCMEEKEDKMIQFRNIMNGIMTGAMRENNERLSEKISTKVTDSVMKELDYRMKIREEREEERFKQLDRTIREYQLSRQQSAISKETPVHKKRESKFFKKNKVRI